MDNDRSSSAALMKITDVLYYLGSKREEMIQRWNANITKTEDDLLNDLNFIRINNAIDDVQKVIGTLGKIIYPTMGTKGTEVQSIDLDNIEGFVLRGKKITE